MSTDIILAAMGGYEWRQVEVWALSLAKSGFQGVGAVIVYDDPNNISAKSQECIDNLKSIGFQVIVMPLRGSVFNQRFHDFYEVLRGAVNNLRYAVITDIRDVYFQADPMDWLEKNLNPGKSFVATSEGMLYKDEPWGADNIKRGFPSLYQRVYENPIYNVGVLAGKASALADLCLSINLIAKASGFPVADQSGFNILLDMEPYKNVAQLVKSEDGFACQSGTFADPSKIAQFRPYLLEPEPQYSDGVKTNAGVLFPIVHQYDRVPAWNSALRDTLNQKLKS